MKRQKPLTENLEMEKAKAEMAEWLHTFNSEFAKPVQVENERTAELCRLVERHGVNILTFGLALEWISKYGHSQESFAYAMGRLEPEFQSYIAGSLKVIEEIRTTRADLSDLLASVKENAMLFMETDNGELLTNTAARFGMTPEQAALCQRQVFDSLC